MFRYRQDYPYISLSRLIESQATSNDSKCGFIYYLRVTLLVTSSRFVFAVFYASPLTEQLPNFNVYVRSNGEHAALQAAGRVSCSIKALSFRWRGHLADGMRKLSSFLLFKAMDWNNWEGNKTNLWRDLSWGLVCKCHKADYDFFFDTQSLFLPLFVFIFCKLFQ